MPTLTVRVATDSLVGVPSGDTGRASGFWIAQGSAGDYGLAIQNASDSRNLLIQDPGAAAVARIRFLMNPIDVAAVASALGANGQINYVQPFVIYKTLQVTTSDNGNMGALALMENPPGSNLTYYLGTATAPQVVNSIGVLVTLNLAVQPTAPTGVLWTPALLSSTEFDLGCVGLGTALHPYVNQWFIDQYAFTVNYSTQSSAFPIPASTNPNIGCQV